MKKEKYIGFKIETEVYNRLKEIATQKEIKLSKLVRVLINEGLIKNENTDSSN